MEIIIKGDLVDIMSVQEEIERIVFDNMETSNRYAIAEQSLNEIWQQLQAYYQNYISKNDGALPKPSTYWHLFMNSVSQSAYFLALAMLENTANTNEQQAKELLQLATMLLPISDKEKNKAFLEEILATLQPLLTNEQLATVKQQAIHEKGDLTSCLNVFFTVITADVGTK